MSNFISTSNSATASYAKRYYSPTPLALLWGEPVINSESAKEKIAKANFVYKTCAEPLNIKIQELCQPILEKQRKKSEADSKAIAEERAKESNYLRTLMNNYDKLEYGRVKQDFFGRLNNKETVRQLDLKEVNFDQLYPKAKEGAQSEVRQRSDKYAILYYLGSVAGGIALGATAGAITGMLLLRKKPMLVPKVSKLIADTMLGASMNGGLKFIGGLIGSFGGSLAGVPIQKIGERKDKEIFNQNTQTKAALGRQSEENIQHFSQRLINEGNADMVLELSIHDQLKELVHIEQLKQVVQPAQ